MEDFSNLNKLRISAAILGVSNVFLIILGIILLFAAYPGCGYGDILPFVVMILASCFRIAAMIRTAVAQKTTAMTIVSCPPDSETTVADALIRHERRISYKKWLWWTRFAMLITVVQFVGVTYLLFNASKHLFQDHTSTTCILGLVLNKTQWQGIMLVVFIIMMCSVVMLQCFAGSDVLRWRSFYINEDNAWKLHYREVFDHGIREALCCMGRVKYLTESEEDEVYSVAQLLGDLVAYRASGTGHLELLTGLALLQRPTQSRYPQEETVEAPEERFRGAAAFHPFAEAAYTGLLLDVGRNPTVFLCAWLYRQGILTPWTRKRLPVLKGDNWWRGHAAAFLKYVNLSAEVLRRGRVNQAKCEAAYFIVVLHHLKSVVIAVRGTETPEDLITDGLCRECILDTDDLDGLIHGNLIPPGSPHHGHSGIVKAARDLFTQIDGNSDNDGTSSESSGFLSSLMGTGCECDGYSLRIVGHSLGGAIAALLGVRLYGRYPNLHVYSYGPLPCVDSAIADACSDFVTSIVYDNEFSSRLSVASILRLQAAAVMALSEDEVANSAIIYKLARRFLFVSNHLQSKLKEKLQASGVSSMALLSEDKTQTKGSELSNASRKQDQDLPLWQDMDKGASSDDEHNHNDSPNSFTNPFFESPANVTSCADPVSQFMESVPSSKEESSVQFPEMFLPGLVIHVVPEKRSFQTPIWRRWRTQDEDCNYRAYIANREAFKDFFVSPSMFIDHLPWRCRYAMEKVLEMRNHQAAQDDVSQLV